MKKMLFAAALAALLPLAVSCGKQNNNTENSLSEPRFVQSAGQLIPAAGSLQSVGLGEGGHYVVGESAGGGSQSSRTKAGADPEIKYTTGEYTVSGNVYTLKGWGTLEFDNSATGDVVLKYTPSGKGSVTVTARFTKSTVNSDIFRSWRVDKTRVSVVDGKTTYAAEFAGCDFSDIAKFLKDNGHPVKDVIPAGHRVSTLSITGAGAFFIVYNDGQADVGSCTVSGNVLNYIWAAADMGYSFETGRAGFSFQDGKCIFVIGAKVDGLDASVKMVLSDIG